MFDPLKHVLKV